MKQCPNDNTSLYDNTITELNNINHVDELKEADYHIEKLKKEIKKNLDELTPELHTILFEKIIKILDYVGALSNMCFPNTDNLEEYYVKQYKNSPAIARKLWLKHTSDIHHKYDQIKNKCFKLIDFLDKEYYKIYNQNPPNWNEELTMLFDYDDHINNLI
jgi:hypothetical protein